MATYKVGRGILTTEHPQSSYGLPVFVLDGNAYGPDDKDGALPMGSMVISALAGETYWFGYTSELAKWFGQSATHGTRWISEIDRLQNDVDFSTEPVEWT